MTNMKILNWFRKRNNNYTWVAGGKHRIYDGWDYGRISLILYGIITLILIVYVAIK